MIRDKDATRSAKLQKQAVYRDTAFRCELSIPPFQRGVSGTGAPLSPAGHCGLDQVTREGRTHLVKSHSRHMRPRPLPVGLAGEPQIRLCGRVRVHVGRVRVHVDRAKVHVGRKIPFL